LRIEGEAIRFTSPGAWPAAYAESANQSSSVGSAVNWPWLGMCLITLASAALALTASVWVTFVHSWSTWQGGLTEGGVLTVVLAAAAFGEMLAERSFAQIPPPDYRTVPAHKAPYVLLPEIVILLLLPLVALAVPVMWIMEWWLHLHWTGMPHGVLFHVIRSVESIAVAAFLYFWVRSMPGVQGRIACSLVQHR
jgi:hypothetical protein